MSEEKSTASAQAPPETLRLGIAQISAELGHVARNTERVLRALEELRAQKPDLVVFPELVLEGYSAGDLYFHTDTKVPHALHTIQEAADPPILLGATERLPSGRRHNAAYLIQRHGLRVVHLKVQLVNYRLFDERRYFSEGTRCRPFQLGGVSFGPLICEDAWYPEPARLHALRGAHVLIVLSASPYNRGKEDIWKTLLRCRAIENLAFVVFCNQAGIQDGTAYWGGSMVWDPDGELLWEGTFLNEHLAVLELPIWKVLVARRRDIRAFSLNPGIAEEFRRLVEEPWTPQR